MMRKFLVRCLVGLMLAAMPAVVSPRLSHAEDAGPDDSPPAEPSAEPSAEPVSNEELLYEIQRLRERVEDLEEERESYVRRQNTRPVRAPFPDVEYRFMFENDIFIQNVHGGDEAYTNGLRSWFLSPLVLEEGSFGARLRDRPILGRPLRILDDWQTAQGESVVRLGAVVGHQIFTPEDIEERKVIKEDRPYAGWLYLGILAEISNDKTTVLMELDVGGTGKYSLAKEAQRNAHSLFGARDPNGWNNQIASSITPQLYFTGDHRFFEITRERFSFIPVHIFDMTVHAQTALGFRETSQSVGTIFRIGWIRHPWYSAEVQERMRKRGDDPPIALPTFGAQSAQIYIFSRLESIFVLRNGTIQGIPFPFTESKHTLNIQPLVFEGETGIVAQPFNLFEARMSVIHRSQETKNGFNDANGHSWAQIQLGLNFY
ncbi:MAG: lipid A deacylase LpxR family protein [Deltaproteobacteria bacterium]|nr:lipid A deacylase LpxR family protein [Deltaproteobacteria bacterium]